MFSYQKTLQYPVRIKNTNPKLAAQIITQYGGPDGELGASLRYLSQRYAMPYPEIQGLLTDIGCEELRHTSYIRKKPLFSRDTRKDPACLLRDKPGLSMPIKMFNPPPAAPPPTSARTAHRPAQ